MRLVEQLEHLQSLLKQVNQVPIVAEMLAAKSLGFRGTPTIIKNQIEKETQPDPQGRATIHKAAELLRGLKTQQGTLKLLEERLSILHRYMAETYVPQVMEQEGLAGGRLAGIGTLVKTTKCRVAHAEGMSTDDVMAWYERTGNGHLINTTVNGNSQTALVSRMWVEGNPDITGVFEVTPYDYVTIRK